MGVLNKFFGRFKVNQDPSVTTQVSSIIQAASGSLILAPEGTGAIMARVPDGTTAGGNARGQGAVDLQMGSFNATKVAGGNYSVTLGFANLASQTYSFSVGYNNSSSGVASVAIGNGNVASSNYSTISGGQSNTASSSHATVVGGASNTASGQYSIAGGHTNVASGARGVAFGYNNTASGAYSVALGSRSQATNLNSIAIGGWSASGGPTASGQFSVALGYTAQAVGGNSVAIGAQAYASGNAAIAFQNARAEQNHSIAFGHFTKGYFEYGFSLANGRFAQNGDAQVSFFPIKTEATLTSGGTTALIGGTPDGSNRAWNVTVEYVAVCTAAGSGTTVVGDVVTGTDKFRFKRVSGTSTIGTVTNIELTQDASMTSAECQYSVGGSNNLQIEFVAPTTANATTFRVVAKVSLVEVAW